MQSETLGSRQEPKVEGNRGSWELKKKSCNQRRDQRMKRGSHAADITVEGVVVLDHNTLLTAFFSRPSPSGDVAEECVGGGPQNAASRVVYCTSRACAARSPQPLQLSSNYKGWRSVIMAS